MSVSSNDKGLHWNQHGYTTGNPYTTGELFWSHYNKGERAIYYIQYEPPLPSPRDKVNTDDVLINNRPITDNECESLRSSK